MSVECVVAIYEEFEQATHAVHALDEAGFPHDQVSFVTHQVGDRVPRDVVRPGDEAEHKAAKGAAFGGLLGMLLGAPLLAIPGVGPLLFAGPLATGLTGALVGGFLGSMAGWGVHEDHIAKYQQDIREGKVLVVAMGNPDEIAEAHRVLQDTLPAELHLHAETSAENVHA